MKKGIINISGISESRCAPVISDIVKEEGQSLIVTATARKAPRLASDLSFFLIRKFWCRRRRNRFFCGMKQKPRSAY